MFEMKQENVRLKKRRRERPEPKTFRTAEKVIGWLLMVLLPAVSFYLMEAYEHNPFTEVRSMAQVYNILIMELIAWFFFFLTGSVRFALRVQWGAAMVFGLVNHYVMAFRSTPFVPWDIYSVKTAVSVAGNYDFKPTLRVVVVTIVFWAVIGLLQLIRLRMEKKFLIRLMPAAAAAIALGLFVHVLQDEDFQIKHYLYPYLFTPGYMTKVNGMAVTFSMDLAYLVVDKPSGYDKHEAAQLLAEYDRKAQEASSPAGDGELPNVIVIMDEAFSDLGILGNFSVNKDYMPFVHQLQQGYENTVTGYLNVSVCGGNTANTEFEFLTGNTMAFFPNGSIPYQQYITGCTPSLASHLEELGYAAYAIHPYNAGGWNRDKVYPLLGFSEFFSLRTFSSPKYVRNYVSDESDFEKIIELYRSKEDGQPLFIFNVTMQNHGSYTNLYPDFEPDVLVAGSDSTALNQYLSLMKLTDEELKKLISYFEEEDEKTVIVFFGDHQPADSVVSPILLQNGKTVSGLSEEEEQLRYQVPYVIWANYDIEEATGQDTSANYLAAEVLKVAGIPLSGYETYLLELKEKYPVLSAVCKEGGDGGMLQEYQQLQYYLMFDWGK